MTGSLETCIGCNHIVKNKKPAVCIPISARNFTELKVSLEQIEKKPHDLIEWRADYFSDRFEPDWCNLVLDEIHRKLPKDPILATCREATPSEEARMDEQIIRTGRIGYLDISDTVGRCKIHKLLRMAHQSKVRVIISHHNFLETPSAADMLALLIQMEKLNPDIVKLAVMPQSRQDVELFIKTAKEYENRPTSLPFIGVSMGQLGKETRIFGEQFGSVLTYATAGQSTAPGQIDAEKLRNLMEQRQKL